MFRLLGFIIGSALSILTILLIIGIPEFHLSNPDIDKRRFDEAVLKLKEKSLDARLIAEDLAEQLAESTQDPVDTDIPTVSSETATGTEEPVVDDLPIPAADTFDDALALASANPQWHAFWNPFRSKIAAQGFVSRLEKVTGLDYRIEKIDIGIYEVSFAYADDIERGRKLAQISTATGLELPET